MKAGEVVFYIYNYGDGTDLDYGVLSNIEEVDGEIKHWSAWRGCFETSWSGEDHLTLVGPVCLGSWEE